NPLLPSASASKRRMKAESSATTTLRGGFDGISDALRGRGELDAGEDALRVEHHHEAIVDLRDRIDEVGSGCRDGVQLRCVDGQHLLDVIDDDAGGAAARL